MNIFKDLQKKAASVHTKKQSAYYKKLRRDAQLAKLKKERLIRLREAAEAKRDAMRELQTAKPSKRRFRFNLVGDLNKFAGRLPSDEELNRTIFGPSGNPRRPK